MFSSRFLEQAKIAGSLQHTKPTALWLNATSGLPSLTPAAPHWGWVGVEVVYHTSWLLLAHPGPRVANPLPSPDVEQLHLPASWSFWMKLYFKSVWESHPDTHQRHLDCCSLLSAEQKKANPVFFSGLKSTRCARRFHATSSPATKPGQAHRKGLCSALRHSCQESKKMTLAHVAFPYVSNRRTHTVAVRVCAWLGWESLWSVENRIPVPIL